MQRVRGIGGVFFRARDKAALSRWYADNLGVPAEQWGGAVFRWQQPGDPGDDMTIWSPFAADSRYFEPGRADFMVNFVVDDLDAMLAQLRAAGAQVDSRTERSEYGYFGWVVDPEGNRIELWQPPSRGPR
jgi:predicted enzyme related to lactoylglutathione lyase